MRAQQALELLGPPQQQRQRGREVIYTYAAHPFASEDILVVIGTGGQVTSIGHEE